MKTTSLTRIALTGAMALATVAFFTPRASADSVAVNSKDKSFLQNAYQDGLAEVQTAQMAAGKTANPDVKAFAEKLAADHTASNNKLKSLADSKKVTLSSDASLVSKGKGKLLDMKSGADFDKAYIDAQISDHKKDIEAFEKEANDAQDADVKALVNKTLPMLKEHLSMAESIQTKIGK